MNKRIQLYKLAQITAEALIDEKSAAAVDSAIADASTKGKVDNADYAQFRSYVIEWRQRFQMMGRQPLPSEQAAAAAAQRAKTAPQPPQPATAAKK